MRPRKLDVGPFRYEVIYGPLTSESGFMQANEKRIVIGENPHQTMAETLLHETLHAVIDMTGLRNTGPEADAEEEKWVASISPVLYAVLRSNPTLVSYLLDRP